MDRGECMIETRQLNKPCATSFKDISCEEFQARGGISRFLAMAEEAGYDVWDEVDTDDEETPDLVVK